MSSEETPAMNDNDHASNPLGRRRFLKTTAIASTGFGLASSEDRPPARRPDAGAAPLDRSTDRPFVVQPVLVYHLYERRKATTWKEWGGLQTRQDVAEEVRRIDTELRDLQPRAGFPLRTLPVLEVHSDATLARVLERPCDLLLVYGAGAGGPGLYSFRWIEALADSGTPNLLFLRHKSGPIFLLYETVHPYFLRRGKDAFVQPNLTLDDVVVDAYEKVLWRLRAWRGLMRTRGATVVAVGGPGSGGLPHVCPASATEHWKLDIVTVPEAELKTAIGKAHADRDVVRETREAMDRYLEDGVVSVAAQLSSVHNAFILARVLNDLMRAHGAQAVTIRNCMSFGHIARTTPCLAFSLINDGGAMAFCESDFSVIPAGMLLGNIADRPVFLNDPTFPHDGVCTNAHCSCTRRLDGATLEPVKILTHCESEYGAAPKVLFRKGQTITNLVPSFSGTRWVGFTGTITDHPDYDICRSQFDCAIHGDWKKLLREMRGFHWITGYGDYLDEIGFVLPKLGIEWETITA